MSPSRKQRSCAIASVLATAVALGAAPGAFAATTVTYNPGGTSPGMNVVDDPGNAVHLVVTSGTQNNHVGLRSNNGLPLTAGSGCLQVSATEVTCFANGPRIVTADLGDGDDRLGHGFGVVNGSFIRGGDGNDTLDGADQADSLDGGPGDDRIQGASGDDVLNGGPGDDVLLTNHLETGNDVKNGGDGNDRIIASRDPGNDIYSGGAGVDLLDFSDASGGVRVSLDGVADDGPAGRPTTPARTSRTSRAAAATTRSWATAAATSSRASPATTCSRRKPSGDADVHHDHRLRRRRHPRRRDRRGPDARRGRRRSPARPRCRRRPGGRRMTCGDGNDRLDTDLADDDTRALPTSCETIDQGAINEGANVRIAPSRLRVSRIGTVRVRLRCPASVRIGCRGRLAAGAPRRALGRARAIGSAAAPRRA